MGCIKKIEAGLNLAGNYNTELHTRWHSSSSVHDKDGKLRAFLRRQPDRPIVLQYVEVDCTYRYGLFLKENLF